LVNFSLNINFVSFSALICLSFGSRISVMAKPASIEQALGDALPLDVELRFYHISTTPTSSTALFSTPPDHVEETTFCESHFLAASLPAKGVPDKELLVFAIEILLFTSRKLTTIFVSKADSTGFLHLLDTRPGSKSIIKTICTTFLSCLIKQRLHGPRILLSLFARSQNQYLFPGSVEYPGKHVLDDRQLIKWWCRTLDPVLQEYAPFTATDNLNGSSDASSEAFIIVPGCDKFDTRAFFPASTKPELLSRWSNSYPRDLIVPDGSAPPRCLIPRFPDDPKGRFLDDLDSEISASDTPNIKDWRSVKSLDQFWEMMSYRQECSAGRLVGFIWLVFSPHEPIDVGFSVRRTEQLPTPNQSQLSSLDPVLPSLPVENDILEPIRSASPPPSSPLLATTNVPTELPSQPQDETLQPVNLQQQASQSNPNNQEPSDLYYDAARKIPVRWPSASRGHLILSENSYQHLMTHLLETDFSNQELAAQSTSSWIDKASKLGGKSNWAIRVTGRRPVDAAPVTQSNGAETKTNVNVLTGMRKKRKVNKENGDVGGGSEMVATTAASNEAGPMPEVATLPRDLIRKKRKTTAQ
jgi:regulator of Ty1 transposition protein 109